MDSTPSRARAPAGPDSLTSADVASYVVAEAIWAPSVHNTQPWWFSAGDRQLSLYADSARRLPLADPAGREMMISCGAALFTVRLALRSLGYVPAVTLLPDPGQPHLVAQVAWGQRAAATDYERCLIDQVLQRRTHRGAFDTVPLPAGLLAALRQAAVRDGAMLRIMADDARRAELAAAIRAAEDAQRLDSARVRELAGWAPPPGSPRRDGVQASSYPARPEHTTPDFPGRDFARGHRWGLPPLATARLARSAGIAAVLTTARDRPADWISAGQALQRILLTASACGVAAALHSQPLEIGWLRDVVRRQLSEGAYPQLVLRLGVVTQTAATMRRPLADVLVRP
jgi:hypothetical protein